MPRTAGRAKIAFFDAYALDAGAGIALRDLIERIDRERFEPVALLPRHGPLAEMLGAADCRVTVIEPPPPLGVYGRGLLDGSRADRLRAVVALARYWAAIARRLRCHGVQLLHCNQTRAVVEAGPAARIAGVPVVWNVRISERLPRPVLLFCDECSDLIIPLTEHDFAGLPDEQRFLSRSTVIRNAVDTRRFSPSLDRASARERLGVGDVPLALSAGVLVWRKGFDRLIRAMSRVVQVMPEARLLIAGEEPDTGGGCKAELGALVAELDLADNVTLLGHRPDMPELLAACDLFVLASRHEGDPAVVLEAMAAGRPVVATAPAAASVREGGTGLVVPGDDVAALSAAMVALLADSARAGCMGEAARAVAEAEHEIDAMVRRYEAAWEMLLS